MMAINQVCHERQLSLEVVLDAVESALVSAYKRNYGANTITAKVDQDTGNVKIFVSKEVVDEVLDDNNEISLAAAREIDPDAELGSVVQVENTPDSFGRIAAQTTKQVILQRIREAESDALYHAYADREGEIINGTVQRADARQAIISLGKVEAILPRSEQIPTERYSAGQRLRAYVVEVSKTARGPQIIVSRTHRNMLRRLLEVEVPEIYNGTVEIKAIAREAGHRSKVAVAALQEGVDPVGSCVGMRGVRIQSIVNELGGEKIDVAEWSPLTTTFIANALSPAKVLNVLLHDYDNDKTAMVVVPDRQLSLAIGKEGQNARLAAKLTGWRIDIKSASEAAAEAIQKASASEELKALVSNRPEVFSLVSDILAEHKDGTEFSGGELNLLSEAIELVGQAELQLLREIRQAEKAARIEEMEKSGIDILAEAESLLSGLDLGEAAPEEAAPEEAESPIGETEKVEAEAGELVEAEVVEAEAAPEEAEVELEAASVVEEAEVEPEAAPVVEEAVEPVADVEPETDELAVAADGEALSELSYIPSVLDSIVEKPKKKETKKRLRPVIVESTDDAEIDLESLSRKKTKQRPRRRDGQPSIRRRKGRSTNEWDDFID